MERFFTFSGRIGRRDWWIGFVPLAVIGIVVGLLFNFPFGDEYIGRLFQLIASVIFLALFAGLSVRRLHDRNKTGLLRLLVFCGPFLVYNVMNLLGIGFTQMNFRGASAWVPGLEASLVLWISAIVSIWAIIELGVLKGTDGPNEYGADPVA